MESAVTVTWDPDDDRRADLLIRRLKQAQSPLALALEQLVTEVRTRDWQKLKGWSEMDLGGHFSLEATLAMARPFRLHSFMITIASLARIGLVILPIVLTWYGLRIASLIYETCFATGADQDDFVRVPFLQLWERGFEQTENVSCALSAAPPDDLGLGLDRFSAVANADINVLLMIITSAAVLEILAWSQRRRREAWVRATAPEMTWLLVRLTARIYALRPSTDANALATATDEAFRRTLAGFNMTSEEIIRQLRERQHALEDASRTVQAQFVNTSAAALGAANALSGSAQTIAGSAARLTEAVRRSEGDLRAIEAHTRATSDAAASASTGVRTILARLRAASLPLAARPTRLRSQLATLMHGSVSVPVAAAAAYVLALALGIALFLTRMAP